MAEALSPADRSSLAAERGPVNMSVGAALVFEAGPGLTRDAVVERLSTRLHLIPRYRQRLEEPRLGLVNPVWADDENFEPEWHVRHATLAPPGGDAAHLAGEGHGAAAAGQADAIGDVRDRPDLRELRLVTGHEQHALVVDDVHGQRHVHRGEHDRVVEGDEQKRGHEVGLSFHSHLRMVRTV